MFEAMLKKASLFKRIIESTKDLLGDISIDFLDSGISFKAVDSSHISLVSVFIDIKSFETFKYERDIKIDINISSLNKIFTRAKDDDTLTLRLLNPNLDSICIEFQSSNNSRKNNYELKLLDIDQESLTIPEQEYSVMISMASDEFKRICQNLMVIGELVTIVANQNENMIKFKSDNDNGDVCSIELQEKDSNNTNEQVTISIGSSINVSFGLKYLLSFSKASILSQRVSICLEINMPILVKYEIEENYIHYYLAPKFKED